MTKLIQLIELTSIHQMTFSRYSVGCIVLTQNQKILLQQRDADCYSFPGCLSTFGGGIEADETPLQALIRELNEELGATVLDKDVISLGAITQAITHHRELIYVYFWHDQHDSITGCYEGTARYYDNCTAPLAHPKIMDDVPWLLNECQNRKLLVQ